MSMIRYRRTPRPHQGERGVTLILVAIAMLSMLAMVALAIDVITLYSARSEAQSAADAAALAAAKMLVDSGVTADPGNAGLQTTAQTAATKAAQDVAGKSAIAGQTIAPGDVSVAFPNTGAPSFGINPTVSVTVQNTNLPTFFSRIWSASALTVRVTAKAEAFNPSNSSSLGTGVPTVARCVKPFLLPNCDPVNPNNPGSQCGGAIARFFDPASGAIVNPGQYPTGVIGETFDLQSNCGPGPACVFGPPTATPGTPALLLYYPAPIATPLSGNSCPSCTAGASDFQNDIECCNPTPLSCGTSSNTVTVDASVYPEGGSIPARSGTECLIHQSGGNGQDILNENVLPGPLNYPLEIQAGNNHPLPALQNKYVSTSDSLVTVPVYEPTPGPPPTAGTPVQVIGFLQLFISQVFPGGGGKKAGEIEVTVVNVSGCGSSATGSPVYSAGVSSVPVRLIQ
jgi:Flp pilus assembly protein TadG